ncbi:MAG: ABC transporter permease [Candidatus Omnitrophica bacterium]|nr:ABC transporter permease [Candidatus Omnitrophota bacterium]MCM8833200.1 ABC transporter permease [Candidatus Omnitrophota bacterium]
MKKIIEKVGSKFLFLLKYTGSITFLISSSLKKIIKVKKREDVVKYINEIGSNSLFLIGIIAFFTGMVLVMETVHTLKKFGAEMYSGGLVTISMIRELGPVLIALIVAGRVGASIAAEIGVMKITEQIDALQVMAVDPITYLVSPRVIAGIISLPCLFIISFFISIIGGFFVGVFMIGIPSGIYLYQSFKYVNIKDLLIGILKVIVFAIIIINVSSYEGLNAYGGAEGVGRASTNAVVSSFFLIILANLIITGLFYFV